MTEAEKDYFAGMVLAVVREVLRVKDTEATGVYVHPSDRKFVTRRAA